MSDVRRLGTEQEDLAADYLLGLGYTIVTRRFKSTHGEIDIVALNGDTLVFVEVKFRSGTWQTPEEAVSNLKVRRFDAAVDDYLVKTGHPEMASRYDIVAIDKAGLRHHIDAFQSPASADSNRSYNEYE